MLEKGIKAPDFLLPDQNHKNHSLADYEGNWILLYFYPKDNTPGCTAEACAIRDAWEEYEKHNVTVIGVSADDAQSHSEFAEEHDLPFTLLADSGKDVIKLYEAEENGNAKRVSYLINPEGKIAEVFAEVDPVIHAREVLNKIDELK